MDRKLAALLLREVFLPGKYPYHIYISSDDYSDNDIETYRDVLFYGGQVLGGFFVINRAGELELRKYGNQSVLTMERKHRFSVI